MVRHQKSSYEPEEVDVTHAMKKTTALKHPFFKALGAAVVALSVIGASASEASARNMCMKHADLEVVLEKHKESQAAIGVASNGSLIQVYATADGATWSIVMTNPQGVSCVVAVGQDWDQRTALMLGQVS